jgi:hypothetical protein
MTTHPAYARKVLRVTGRPSPDLCRAQELVRLLGRTLYKLEWLAKQVFRDRLQKIKDDFQSSASFHR